MLLKVYCSSFSAVATVMFTWPMIDLLRDKDKSLEWTVPAFKCDQLKRKRNMESTVWSFTMESVAYSLCMKRMWKLQYEFADARIDCFTEYQFSSWFIRFCLFKIWYCRKQHMYRFLPFGFINVSIFVKNPCGFYSTFFETALEYPNSLYFDRTQLRNYAIIT